MSLFSDLRDKALKSTGAGINAGSKWLMDGFGRWSGSLAQKMPVEDSRQVQQANGLFSAALSVASGVATSLLKDKRPAVAFYVANGLLRTLGTHFQLENDVNKDRSKEEERASKEQEFKDVRNVIAYHNRRDDGNWSLPQAPEDLLHRVPDPKTDVKQGGPFIPMPDSDGEFRYATPSTMEHRWFILGSEDLAKLQAQDQTVAQTLKRDFQRRQNIVRDFERTRPLSEKNSGFEPDDLTKWLDAVDAYNSRSDSFPKLKAPETISTSENGKDLSGGLILPLGGRTETFDSVYYRKGQYTFLTSDESANVRAELVTKAVNRFNSSIDMNHSERKGLKKLPLPESPESVAWSHEPDHHGGEPDQHGIVITYGAYDVGYRDGKYTVSHTGRPLENRGNYRVDVGAEVCRAVADTATADSRQELTSAEAEGVADPWEIVEVSRTEAERATGHGRQAVTQAAEAEAEPATADSRRELTPEELRKLTPEQIEARREAARAASEAVAFEHARKAGFMKTRAVAQADAQVVTIELVKVVTTEDFELVCDAITKRRDLLPPKEVEYANDAPRAGTVFTLGDPEGRSGQHLGAGTYRILTEQQVKAQELTHASTTQLRDRTVGARDR